MKYYYKLFLIKIMAFFGIKFTKFCAKIPRLKNIAYLMLYEQTASTAMPPHGTILQYDHIQPIELTNKNFTDVVFAQFDKHLNYAGLRVALIAHWDPQRIIDPYVFYYARHLKEIGYSTILCSADEIKELDNSKNILDAVIYRGNEGYDFSSWKSAFSIFPSLFESSEILLTNDSIFGPIGDMRPLFDSMQALDCDFWGLVENNEFRPHLQSFFIALKHNALKHPAFSTFLNNIEPSDKREDSIQYEVKLTQWLISQNLVGATRFPAPSSDYPYTSLHHYTTLFLQSGYFPFVKRRMLFNNPIAANLRKLPALIKNKGYPVDLIVSYAKRCNMKLDHEF